ncbi:hypothetical protein EVAR_72644_1 [Eumeta japonica]|uniref:Uncharacterized protein n=1 Tax=Eumeta variegata TaxID=151549 RepID=A0A4C1T7A6_EUMVA|nr:hypothetical protein EVAR_72644_1 [Eumeta japonica]
MVLSLGIPVATYIVDGDNVLQAEIFAMIATYRVAKQFKYELTRLGHLCDITIAPKAADRLNIGGRLVQDLSQRYDIVLQCLITGGCDFECYDLEVLSKSIFLT